MVARGMLSTAVLWRIARGCRSLYALLGWPTALIVGLARALRCRSSFDYTRVTAVAVLTRGQRVVVFGSAYSDY
jgi:hypothetical protein